MGFWFTFFLWAATFVLQDYFRAKLPSRDPDGVGDFKAPTATQGRVIPQVVGGTVRIEGPNTLWFGDWDAEPVTVETGIVFKRNETVGYTYRIAAALGQFVGRTAGLTGIYIGDDKVFDYVDDAGGVPQTVVDVNLPSLFGGEKSGGGFVGRFRCFTGGDAQAQSAFLADPGRVGPLQSEWPGITYVVMTNSEEPIAGPLGIPVGTTVAETKGALIGETNQLRDIKFEFQCFDTLANGGLGNELGLTLDRHFIGRDANPIAAAYRVLTDPDWSIATSNISVAQFQTIANQIYDEGLGYSRTLDSETNAFEILAEIEKHIDGYIGPNPVTGFIEVKLARDDYTPASEFQADGSNILAITDYAKPDWPQTKNDVKVRFINRDKNYSDDHAVAQDMANRIITGKPNAITLRFEGVRAADVANIIVARTSRAYFWPMAKFKIEMDRTAEDIRPGDVVIVNDEGIEAVDLACRVIRIATGDPLKQSVKLDVVEDVFRIESGLQADSPPSDFVPPSPDPVAVTSFAVTTAPGWLLVRDGETAEARLLYLVSRDAPNSAAVLRWQRRTTFGSGTYNAEADEAIPAFALAGTLRSALGYLTDTANDSLGAGATGTEFEVSGSLPGAIGGYDPQLSINGIFVINPGAPNEEFVAVTDVNPDSQGIVCTQVFRAIGDSTMQQHDAGSPVWYVDLNGYVQENQGVELGGGVRYKLAGQAYGTTEDLGAIAYEPEVEVVNTITRPPPIALIENPNEGGAAFYPAGPWAGDFPNIVNSPSASGVNLEVWKRVPQSNPVYQADSRDDSGAVYANNSVLVAEVPLVNVYVYDLDATPDPIRADAVGTFQYAGGDDRINAIFITTAQLQTILPSGGTLNARLEITIEYTNASGDIPAGVESRSQFIDRLITLPFISQSREAADATVLLLHFEGADETTQVLDYSPQNFTVTNVGCEIDAVTTPDDSLQSGVLSIPAGMNYLEVPDDNLYDLDHDLGYLIQFRVNFGNTVGGIVPIISKGADTADQRAFQVYFNGNAITYQVSTDGTTWITRTETTAYSAGIWYDITIDVRNLIGASRSYLFESGNFDDDYNTSYGNVFASNAPVRIGYDGLNTLPKPILLDEVRILNRSIYRAPFTPDGIEFPGRNLYVPLQMSFDRLADAATVGDTEDLNRWPMTFGATTEIDDAQTAVAGSVASLRCNGVNSTTAANGDGVWLEDTPSSIAWDIGTLDFTIEAFVRFAVLPATAGADMELVSKVNRNAGTSQMDFRLGFTTSGNVRFGWSPSGSSVTNTRFSETAVTIAVDTWYHVAVQRRGDDLELLFDGDRVLQVVDEFDDVAGNAITNGSGARVAMGRIYDTGSPAGFLSVLDGWLDMVRVQVGTVEYPDAATYTVPTAPFPVDPAPEPPPPPPPVAPANWSPFNLG